MNEKEQIKNLIIRYKKENKAIQRNKAYSKDFKKQAECFFREIIFDLEQILSANK